MCACKLCTFYNNSPGSSSSHLEPPHLQCNFVSATRLSREASPSAASCPSCGLGFLHYFETCTIWPSHLRSEPPPAPGSRTSPMQFCEYYKSLTCSIRMWGFHRAGEGDSCCFLEVLHPAREVATPLVQTLKKTLSRYIDLLKKPKISGSNHTGHH